MKSQLTGKDPDAGKDRRLEKEATEHEVVGLHHGLNGHELEQTPRDAEDRGAWCVAVHGVSKSWTCPQPFL